MEQLIASSDNAIASSLCHILENLLVPDTAVIEKATSDLRELNGHASFVPSLFSVLSQSDSAEIRKLSAVIFRRKVSRQWKSFTHEVCIGVRKAVLESLLIESDAKVSQSLCQVAATIAKYEFAKKDGSWPDLFEVVKRGMKSPQSAETALYLLSVVCESAGEQLEPHYINLLTLIGETLKSAQKDVGNTEIYAVNAFNSLIPYLGDEYVNLVRPLVLNCIAVTRSLLAVDECRATDIMEVFETLIETEVSFISPFVKDLVLFCLQIGAKTDFEDATRIRALSLLRWIIKLKKKAIIKLSLTDPILDALFPIIAAHCDEDDNVTFTSDDVESQDPITSSLYLIDELALHLPPEKLYKSIMPKIEALAMSSEPCHRRGLVLILACLAEGTSEFIKKNHLKSFLEMVCHSSLNENQTVRNASLFAIGQFSEHLQPDISKYSSQVMPLLFEILQKTPETNKGITRAYYAVENFVENLENDILHYLDQLMSHLLMTLQNSTLIHTRELVVSAIGAVANAAKENLLPYLEQILTQLKLCLPDTNRQISGDSSVQGTEADNLSLLQMQTLDTLGVLARTVGKENFLPLAENCLMLGMNLLENEQKDPDMRRSAYGLFSAIASIVEEKLSPYLPVIVKHMTDSLRSIEGVTAHYTEGENGEAVPKNFSFLDDETDLTTELSQDEDDDDDIEGFSVENAYIDEKSDACEAIGEIAKHTKAEFAPFLQVAFEEVFRLVEFPHSDVRKAAVASSGELTMCSHKLRHETFPAFLSEIFPVICKTIAKDTERLVVMGAIATVNQMVECSGMNCFLNGEASLKELMESLHLVITEKSSCQDAEDDVDDEQQAEYDEMLIEYCGEILPVLAGSLGSVFLPYFIGFLPFLIARMKPSCTSSERSFSAGTIAETFQKLGPHSSVEVVGNVIPRLLELTRDSETEVRNNSIFGIGIILQNADSAGLPFYPATLNILSQVLETEKERQVIDNVLGAVSRLVTANKESVPLQQVIPVLLDHLPVTEDHEEDGVVYSCLSRILQDGDCDAVVMTRIIALFVKILGIEEVQQDIRESILTELKSVHQRDPALTSQAFDKMTAEEITRIKKAFQS